ncbi:hypothetical protein B0H12DRAFT_1148001 [Mycena haematopus]|nr:hypothetical protein B0H12DRAFT_1332224 [Mycena haematopus]KAJ7229319.1 hypothetical protein B0H12DRAFT_1148001 [Mycena haematopus]
MASRATFCDVPVSTVFDCNAPISSVSLDWVINSGLRTSNSRASGVLTLPCTSGLISTHVNNLPVASSLPSDVVLGLDWFRFVSEHTSESAVRLSSGLLELRQGNSTSAASSPPSAQTILGDPKIGLLASANMDVDMDGIANFQDHGHSFCLVCIRLNVEKSFECPYCRTTMTAEPIFSTDFQNILNDFNPQQTVDTHIRWADVWKGVVWPKKM